MRLILHIESDDLAERASEFGHFTTVRPSAQTVSRGLIFLSLDGRSYGWVGRVDAGAMVATRKRRVKISELTEIEPTVTVDELAGAMPSRVRRHLGPGLVPQATGDAALRALGELRPGLGDAIARLTEADIPRTRRDGAARVIAQEKDAIGVALGFLGIERDGLGTWAEPEGRQAGFLRGLPATTLREDAIIAHDLGVFSDWEVVRRSAVGSVHFERGSVALTVVNVNRTPVEEVLGVDLVYYHELYEAFVLVQYKRMDRETDLGAVYRPDANLEPELERMRAIVAEPPDAIDSLNYRLGPGVCFIKLCETTILDPASTDLIPGLYLPIEYFDACRDVAVGPRGGPAYGYNTIPRYLNNSAFISLVQDAWVGSVGDLTDALRTAVEEMVASGRSVMLAVGSGKRARRGRQ